MQEIRLEVNIDVAKNDITPETVRSIVEANLREALERGPYVKLQSVLIIPPGRK